jgi:DNA-binding MarR family transcriptional regulator
MNAIFFGLKRAHHGVLRITRRGLAKLGLTAARFDMMYVVYEHRGLRQSSLRRALGVSAPTVSRMLASLEELGLLKRKTAFGYRRQRFVSLTAVGLRCIRRAIRLFIRWGAAQLAVDSALCPDRWFDDTECFVAMQTLEGLLCSVRRAYGDVASLHFPWHPDD